MALSATSREILTVVGLCVIWYSSSSLNNVVGKIVLSDFPYPMTVSMVQLVSIWIYCYPILKLWSIPSSVKIPTRYWFTMILPLAFGKFIASVMSHISIWKVPVSYAHTVKATMPLFTVLLSRILLGESQTTKVYLSLVPIIGGVAIATVTELSFAFIGLFAALGATVGFSLQNIFSKKCLKETGIHHLRLLYILARIAAVCFTPLWIWHDVTQIVYDSSLMNSPHTPRLIGLMVIDGFCNFMQNMLAFTIIAMVTPLTYAVANATKRISIITVSLILLKNPVTFANVCGMMIAIVGVLLYNKTKYDQNQASKKSSVLPVNLHPQKSSYSAEASLLLQNTAPYDNNNSQTQLLSHPENSFSNGVANGHAPHSGRKGKHRVFSVVRMV